MITENQIRSVAGLAMLAAKTKYPIPRDTKKRLCDLPSCSNDNVDFKAIIDTSKYECDKGYIDAASELLVSLRLRGAKKAILAMGEQGDAKVDTRLLLQTIGAMLNAFDDWRDAPEKKKPREVTQVPNDNTLCHQALKQKTDFSEETAARIATCTAALKHVLNLYAAEKTGTGKND